MEKLTIIENFFSDATITINLKDVNDNYPIFDQDQYSVSINENVFPEILSFFQISLIFTYIFLTKLCTKNDLNKD